MTTPSIAFLCPIWKAAPQRSRGALGHPAAATSHLVMQMAPILVRDRARHGLFVPRGPCLATDSKKLRCNLRGVMRWSRCWVPQSARASSGVQM